MSLGTGQCALHPPVNSRPIEGHLTAWTPRTLAVPATHEGFSHHPQAFPTLSPTPSLTWAASPCTGFSKVHHSPGALVLSVDGTRECLTRERRSRWRSGGLGPEGRVDFLLGVARANGPAAEMLVRKSVSAPMPSGRRPHSGAFDVKLEEGQGLLTTRRGGSVWGSGPHVCPVGDVLLSWVLGQ